MPRPAYSPDLVASDYHLFRSFHNHLNGDPIDLDEAFKNELIQYFASNHQTFFERGITKIAENGKQLANEISKMSLIDVGFFLILKNHLC